MTVENIIEIAKNVGHVNAAKVLAEFIKEDTKDGVLIDTAKLMKEFLKNGYKRFLPDILIYSMNYGIDGNHIYKIFTEIEIDGNNRIFDKKEIRIFKDIVDDETNNEVMCTIADKLLNAVK